MKFENRYRLTKMAFNITDLNDPTNAGYAIAQAIKFLLRNVPFSTRPFTINKLKQKILMLDEKAIHEKYIPTTAILGQCMALIKNLLHGNDSRLIKNILQQIYKNL